jgi:hypothetical protein
VEVQIEERRNSVEKPLESVALIPIVSSTVVGVEEKQGI